MKLSVIIPTCNRNSDLVRCLESLSPEKQDVSTEQVEWIVTDDGKVHPARDIVKNQFLWATYTKGPSDGPAANRNHGANLAKGEWIAFIDDDCIAAPDWIANLLQVKENEHVDVIEGKTIIPDKKDNPFLHGVENHEGDQYWSCNLAINRNKFKEIGGFDDDFKIAGGEDMEFAWRIKQQGLNSYFSEGALVLHPQRMYTLKGFLKRVPQKRWILLYYQKTGEAPPPHSAPHKVLAYVLNEHLIGAFRIAKYHLLKNRVEGINTRLFFSIWPFVVMPFSLPYLIYWEFKFRKMRPELNFKHAPR